MAVYKRPNSPYYVIEFELDGHRYKRTSGTRSKAEARDTESAMRAELRQRRHALPSLTLGEAVERYILTRIMPTHATERTKKGHVYQLHSIRDQLGADTYLEELTRARLEEWRLDLLKRYKPNTANRMLAFVRAIINCNAGMAATVPFAIKPIKYNDKRERFLSPDEEKRLIAACASHLRDFVVFLLNSGLRKTEALTLKWSQVEFPVERQVTVTVLHAKNDKPRRVPLPNRAGELLRALHAHRPNSSDNVFVWHDCHTGAWRPLQDVRSAFEAACRRAGIADLRIHDLRHSYASRLVQRGVSLRAVQDLLGHSSITMVQRYAHLAPSDHDRAVAVLDAKGSTN